MSFTCEFARSRRILFIHIDGSFDPREALRSIVDTVADGRFDGRYEALAESIGTSCASAVEGAWALAELLKNTSREFETRIAITVEDRDLYDLGRHVAIQLDASGGLLMECFKRPQEARQWLVAE